LTIVVTSVICVIYNFEQNGLSKVIFAEKVIYLFLEIISFFKITVSKLTKLSSYHQKAVLKPVTLLPAQFSAI